MITYTHIHTHNHTHTCTHTYTHIHTFIHTYYLSLSYSPHYTIYYYRYLCGFFFLFQPTHEVVRQFHKTWTKLSDPSTLKIGIHIRVGDYEFAAPHNLEKGRKQILDYEDYFRCAQEVEDTRRKANQSVVWYVISDSLSIRLAAQEKFGSKVQ